MPTPVIHSFNANKKRAQIYAHMACMTAICFVSALVLSRFKLGFIHDVKRDYLIVTIIFIIALVLLMVMIANQCKKACEENKGKFQQYGFAYLFVLIASFSVSGAMIVYEMKSIMIAFAVSALVFVLSAVYAHNAKDDLRGKWGPHIAKICIGVLIMGLSNVLLGSSMLNSIISIACFGLIVVLEIWNAQSIDEKLLDIENTTSRSAKAKGLVAENFTPYAAVCLFSQIINLFLSVLRICGDSKEFAIVLDVVPNLSITDFSVDDAFNAVSRA